MNFKSTLATISLVTLVTSSAFANAFSESLSDYASKYVAPCLVGLGVGYVVDQKNGLSMGAVACSVTFTYGEFSHGSKRTMSSADLDLVDKMMKQSSMSVTKDMDSKLETLNQKVEDGHDSDRRFIRSSMTDMGVFLEKDLTDKIDKKLENPKVVQDIDNKIDLKVKQEMANEYKSQEKNIVDKVSEKVVKKLISETVIIEPAKENTKVPAPNN